QSRILHYCEVGIEITWPAKSVPALYERHGWTVARRERSKIASIKSSFATGLDKARVRVGRYAVSHKLRRFARPHWIRKRRPLSTRWVRPERGNGHRINRSEKILLLQYAGFEIIKDGLGIAHMEKDRPRNLPSTH